MVAYLGLLVRVRFWVLLFAGASVAIGGAFFVFSGNGEEELLTVQRGDFVQEVSVSGKVTAAQNVELGFDQTGRVAAVYAKVGDRVAQGQVLGSIENGEIRAEVLQKEAALETAKAELRALEAGTRPEEIAVEESNVSAAKTDLEQAREKTLNAIKDAYTTADDSVHYRVDQFMSNPRTSSPQINFTGVEGSLEMSVEGGRPRMEELLAAWGKETASLSSSSTSLTEAEKAISRLTEIRNYIETVAQLINSLTSNATLSQTTIDTYRKDIATARTNLNSALSSVTTAVTSEKSAVTSLVTAEKNLALAKAPATAEDIEAERARVKAAEADLAREEARLRKTLVIAPFSGVITKMDAKVGALASANTPLIGMISTGKFEVESYVPEINLSYISVGNEASITLDSYGSAVPFAATVVSIDPAETIRDGVPTYRAVLQFKGQDERVKSGMTANVVITTERKSNVISIPQGLVKERDGKKFVRVKEGEASVDREVEVGSVSSMGSIEILSGLEEGERVVVGEKEE